MLTNFRKAFKPTSEEIERAQKIVEHYAAKRERFLVEKGFNTEEMNILEEIDGKEAKSTRTFVTYYSRYDQLRFGWVTVEEVKEDIRQYKEDSNHDNT